MEYEVVGALVEAQYQRARLEDALTREQSQIDDPVQGMKPEPIPRIAKCAQARTRRPLP